MAIRDISKIDCSQISEAQIGACHKVIHTDGNFYLVENSKGAVNEDGDLIEYKVTFSASKGFQCTCKAAEYGTLCWHIKASVACEAEVTTAIAELNRLIAAQAVKTVEKVVTTVDAETLARVQAAAQQPRKASKAKAYSPKPFSLLR